MVNTIISVLNHCCFFSFFWVLFHAYYLKFQVFVYEHFTQTSSTTIFAAKINLAKTQ